MTPADPLTVAHTLLRARTGENSHPRTEDPADPTTVQAMQIVLHLPKQQPPRRADLLEAAARAVVAVCLDPRVVTDERWHNAVTGWYDHLIRKVARRARNRAWTDTHTVEGITVDAGTAQARAFLPSPVSEVPPVLRKLQIGGTDVPAEAPEPWDDGAPFILVDADLGMTIGKAAAQVGHASMLLAARQPATWVRDWAGQGYPLQVREVPGVHFREVLGWPGVVEVRDAGFTEVSPGASTVLAHPGRVG